MELTNLAPKVNQFGLIEAHTNATSHDPRIQKKNKKSQICAKSN